MQVYKDLCELIKKIDYVCELFYLQNYFEGNEVSRNIIGVLGNLLGSLAGSEFADNVNMGLARLLEFQENEDYIGVADFYKDFLKTECVALRDSLRKEGVWQDVNDFYKKNYNAANEQIRLMLRSIEAQTEDIPGGYELAETAVGSFTLQVNTVNNRKLYLSSASDPYEEARIIAKGYTNGNYAEYVILGLGMGYLANELAAREDICKLAVCEHDKYVIKAAFHYMDLEDLLKSDKINIFYDPMLAEFSRILSDKNEKGIIIHHPSMMNIRDAELRDKLNDFFIYDNSVRTQGKKLYGNFRMNLSHKTRETVHFADALKARFEGKNVLFIAAGPSFEDSAVLLRECVSDYTVTSYTKDGIDSCSIEAFMGAEWYENCEDYIVVCVGTVLRNLISIGIKPDYVIMSDPQDNMINQIEGIDTSDISLICLSTLYYRVVNEWKGAKYIAFQRDFALSEEYAEDNGLMLFETGGSVSTLALDILLRFHCRKVVCLGLDLAYVNNKRHAGERCISTETTKNLRLIRSVNNTQIYTSVNLDNYRLWIERRLKRRTKDEMCVELINASNGAFIEGMNNKKIW